MTRPIGFAVSGGLSPTQIVECATLAEELGYESLWVAEGHGGDQFAILSACAMATSRIRLGTAISSIFVRSLPTIAMAAATLDQLSQGRFVLGLGSSHRVQVEPEHGLTYDQPLTRLRDAINCLRPLIENGTIKDFKGSTIRIEQFDFWFEPSGRKMPIYLAGLFPKMLQMTGELGDGLILTRTSIDQCASILEQIRLGAESAQRDPKNIEITSLFPTAVSEHRSDALAQLRPGIAMYSGFFPRYNKLMAQSGFEAEANAIRERWQQGDKAGAEAAVSDSMIDAIGIAGTANQCLERIEAYRDAGIELPILSPRTQHLDDFKAVLKACAPGGR